MQRFTLMVLAVFLLIAVVPVSSLAATSPHEGFAIRINAGGASYVDQDGQAWAADRHARGGSPFRTSASIAGTRDDALYRTERFGMQGYAIPVPVSGPVQVRIHLAEIWFTSTGQRVFDIVAEGRMAAQHVDVHGQVGAYRATVLELSSVVEDGVFDLEFQAATNHAKVSAIEVLAAPAGASVTPASSPAADELVVDGNLLRVDGRRWIARGANLYALPAGWSDATDAVHRNRDAIFDRMAELGLNSVRLNFWASAWEGEAEGLSRQEQVDRLVDLVESATARDLRVLLSWHDFTNDSDGFTTDYDAIFPMIEAVLSRPEIGENPLVYLEPFNEPGGDISWEGWRPGIMATMTYLRSDLGYERTLFIDTPGWSYRFSPSEADRIIEHDAQLRGTNPNVVFANHRYPGASSTYVSSGDRADHDDEVLRHVGQYPIVATEHGWDLDAGHGAKPEWLTELLAYLVDDRIPAGHNGVFAWMWHWDPNGLTQDWDSQRGITTLSEHGRLWQQHFWDALD